MQLTADQKDALQELLNIGVGRAAGSLSQMLDKPISLQIPYIAFGTYDELQTQIAEVGSDTLSSVKLSFTGSFSGSSSLVFPAESTPKLAEALTGEPCTSENFDSLKEAALTEIGNIVLNGVMGSITNILEHRITYQVPSFQEDTIQNLLSTSLPEKNSYLLWAQTHFKLEAYDISGDILLMFKIEDLNILLQAIKDFAEAVS